MDGWEKKGYIDTGSYRVHYYSFDGLFLGFGGGKGWKRWVECVSRYGRKDGRKDIR